MLKHFACLLATLICLSLYFRASQTACSENLECNKINDRNITFNTTKALFYSCVPDIYKKTFTKCDKKLIYGCGIERNCKRCKPYGFSCMGKKAATDEDDDLPDRPCCDFYVPVPGDKEAIVDGGLCDGDKKCKTPCWRTGKGRIRAYDRPSLGTGSISGNCDPALGFPCCEKGETCQIVDKKPDRYQCLPAIKNICKDVPAKYRYICALRFEDYIRFPTFCDCGAGPRDVSECRGDKCVPCALTNDACKSPTDCCQVTPRTKDTSRTGLSTSVDCINGKCQFCTVSNGRFSHGDYSCSTNPCCDKSKKCTNTGKVDYLHSPDQVRCI